MRKNTLFILLLITFNVGAVYGVDATCPQRSSDMLQRVLETDDTCVKLAFAQDAILLKQLSAGQGGWNWSGQGVPLPLLEQYRLAEVHRLPQWKLISVTQESSRHGEIVTAVFVDTDAKLKLRSIWTAYRGPGPVEHTVEVINEGKDDIEIGYCPSLELSLRLPDSKVQHWWVEKGARKPSDHGTYTTTIGKGFDYVGISRPYSGTYANDPIPWQCITVEGQYGLYTGIESTGCVMQKARLEDETSLKVTLGIETAPGTFRARLEPREVYTFPTVFIGCYKGDIDDGCNRLHRWVERWLCPPSDDVNLPLLGNNSWGSGVAVDEVLARKMIDDCAALGLEMYHVDAGWYKAIGWWREDPTKFPNGLRVVSDYAHAKGLKFGLWVGWTQGGNTTVDREALSVFEPEMRTWFPKDMPPDWKPSPDGFTSTPVCLACEDAKAWCVQELRRMVNDYKIDLLEHDQIMVVWECERQNHGHTDSPGDISHRCCTNYYDIHDTLMRDFPGLLIENCVNGGRQTDFGVIKHSHYTCANDNYDPISLRRTFYDVSFPLPPRILEGYIASHLGETLDNFRYCLRSAMLGWCTIMMDMSKWTDEQKAAGKRQFEIYKTTIRPQIRDGNLYHVSRRPGPQSWDAFEYYTPATGKGVVLAFLAQCDQSDITIKLKGLDPDSKYDARFEDGHGKNAVHSGHDLMEAGVKVHLPSYDSSELIYFERQP